MARVTSPEELTYSVLGMQSVISPLRFILTRAAYSVLTRHAAKPTLCGFKDVEVFRFSMIARHSQRETLKRLHKMGEWLPRVCEDHRSSVSQKWKRLRQQRVLASSGSAATCSCFIRLSRSPVCCLAYQCLIQLRLHLSHWAVAVCGLALWRAATLSLNHYTVNFIFMEWSSN